MKSRDRSLSGRRLAAVLAVTLLTLLFVAAAAAAAPGDPDLTFNGTGMRTYQPRGLAEQRVADVLVEPGGKILVLDTAGNYHGENHDIVVMRLESDGSPDPSFGLGGVASIDFSKGGTGADDYAGSMALQPNGKIIVAGKSYIDPEHLGEGPPNARATVARLNADGTLDTGFGVGSVDEWAPGELALEPGIGESGGSCGCQGDSANGVVVRPDGRIVVAGEVEAGAEGSFFALGLTADGHRDTTFGSYGRAFVDFGANDVAHAVALAPNGDVILAGESFNGYAYQYAVARLSSSGSPVAGFGSDGKRLLSDVGTGSLSDVALQPDGKLVFTAVTAEASLSDVAGLIRLNPDGSTDSLAGQAFQPVPSAGGNLYAGSVAVDPEGRLLVGGIDHEAEGKISFELARFTAAGAIDTTFGNGGVVKFPVGESISNWGFGPPFVALQPDGRIVLAGTDNGLVDVRRFVGGSPPTSQPGPAPAGAASQPPAAGTAGPPRAKITKEKINSKRHRATFAFRAPGASSFRCALVKPKKKHHAKLTFRGCHSPQTYKGLLPGRYEFEVRALGTTGSGPVATKRFGI